MYILILTNVKLRYAIIFSRFNVDVLTIFSCLISDQALNAMRFISAIPKLMGQNYVLWREEFDTALALAEKDLALQSQSPLSQRSPKGLRMRPMKLLLIGRETMLLSEQSIILRSTSEKSQTASARLSSRKLSQMA